MVRHEDLTFKAWVEVFSIQCRKRQCFYLCISDAKRNCVLQPAGGFNSVPSFAREVLRRHTRALLSGMANSVGRAIGEYAQIRSKDFAACCGADHSSAMSDWTENKLMPLSFASIAVVV